MKISILNNCDVEGGAARAAFRICNGLRASGIDIAMLVQHRKSDNYWVNGPAGSLGKISARVLPHLDIFPLAFYPNKQKKYWSVNWLSNPGLNYEEVCNSDVVHMHWIGGGFIPISAFKKINVPLVWTLHDTWGFTGGCHNHAGCESFKKSCGCCPQLGSQKQFDLSRQIWKKKNKSWASVPFIIVTPSNWLADEAKKSSLFRDRSIKVIPNGLDLTVFKPIEKKLARKILSLPETGGLILFGAINATADENKGYGYLATAMNRLSKNDGLDIASLLVFGSEEPKELPKLGFPIRFFGRLYDDVTLTLLYSAADVMVVPSVQEAFGQTATEAMACGTPVVAFGATGLLDIVSHKENGYLAKPYDPNDLANGIEWILVDNDRRIRLSENARRKCEDKFDILNVSKQYIQLYESLL